MESELSGRRGGGRKYMESRAVWEGRRGVESTWSRSCLGGEEGGKKYMESELSGRRGGG